MDFYDAWDAVWQNSRALGAGVLLPVFCLAFSGVMRGKEFVHSSGADYLLTLVSFDLALVLTEETGEKIMAGTEFEGMAREVFLSLGLLSLFASVIIIVFYEAPARKWIDAARLVKMAERYYPIPMFITMPPSRRFPMIRMCAALIVIIMVTFCHVRLVL